MNFVVYKSSAGSGKTHTLVKEYIRLVVENPGRYRSILAITFTNKAANEMKGRILEDLEKLTALKTTKRNGKFNDLVGSLKSHLHLSEEEISKRALIGLSLILHNYSGFAVSTIDSFVHKLVRSFARDLRLPPNFEVEMDTDKLISKSIDLLISKVGTDMELTKALVQFIETKMEDEKSWNIEWELKNFAKILLNEDSYEAIDKLKELEIKDFTGIGKKLHAWIGIFKKQVKEIAEKAYGLIQQNNIPISSFYRGNTGISAYFKNLAAGRIDKLKPNSFVETTVEEDKWFSGKCTNDDRAAINSIKGQLGDAYLAILDLKEKDYQNYSLFLMILQNIYPIAVLNVIEKVMDEFRQNENIVHISEFNKRIAKIVGSEPVPFIFERIGEKYRHFLVDEFQDTSLMQWQNMLPLYENSLGSNRFNMIVGDGKQAIYRFRSGEVEQFAKLPGIYKAPNDPIAQSRENLLKSQYNEKVLGTNFRSNVEIVKFNNGFFSFVRQKLSDRHISIYDTVVQDWVSEKTGGSVHIEFMDHQDLKKEDFAIVECERLHQIIINDLAKIPLKDIAILTRSNKEAGNIAQFMLEKGINVISAEALLLSSSEEVRFIISFLNHLNNRKDKIPVSEIITYLFSRNLLNYPSIDMAFDASLELKGRTDEDEGKVKLENLLQLNRLSISFSAISTSTLFEAIGQLVHIFKLDPAGDNPFILFFFDVVQEFLSKYNDGLAEFLKYWEDTKHKHSIIVPEGIDAIQIMTIHKAKGLQFPVVIFPFAEDSVRPTKKYQWVNLKTETVPELKAALLNTNNSLKETIYSDLYEEEYQKSLLDMVNLLYVTLTRPEVHLYILTKIKIDKKKGGWKLKTDYPDIPDLFYMFLADAGLWSDEERVYTFGEIPVAGLRKIDIRKKTIIKDAKDRVIGSRKKKLIFSKHAPKVWDVEDPERNRQWGNLVHELLAKIEYAKDVNQVIDEAFRDGLLDKEDKNTLAEKINKIISNPEIKPFYEEGTRVMNEKDILLQDGSTIRPDRLAFRGDKLAIIDYKTGQEEKYHIAQLNNYASKLQLMGYTNINKYLLYIDEEVVVEV